MAEAALATIWPDEAMQHDIEIRKSRISGRGVFARRHFLNLFDEDYFVLVAEPERFVNHSCANNTRVERFTDVAVRDILPGEEITSDYRSGGTTIDFVCGCGAPNCRTAARA